MFPENHPANTPACVMSDRSWGMKEKLVMVRIVPQKELTNNRMYGSKIRTYGNIWTIKRWGEWRRVKMCPEQPQV
jgi:hypothetical protein